MIQNEERGWNFVDHFQETVDCLKVLDKEFEGVVANIESRQEMVKGMMGKEKSLKFDQVLGLLGAEMNHIQVICIISDNCY